MSFHVANKPFFQEWIDCLVYFPTRVLSYQRIIFFPSKSVLVAFLFKWGSGLRPSRKGPLE